MTRTLKTVTYSGEALLRMVEQADPSGEPQKALRAQADDLLHCERLSVVDRKLRAASGDPRRLMEQGRRVGLVTNDQAPELVDSEMLRQGRLAVAEVAGSCFCCNFNGLVDALKKLVETEVLAWRCLQPGRPNPTYRFGEVVSA